MGCMTTCIPSVSPSSTPPMPTVRLNHWETVCMELCNRLLDARDAWPFREPVDPVKCEAPVSSLG